MLALLVLCYDSPSPSSPALPLARIIPLITDHAQLVFSTQSPGSFAQVSPSLVLHCVHPGYHGYHTQTPGYHGYHAPLADATSSS